ncbi:DUF2235 domain-containing protein [Phanerochaete sordida]|uniref:DUF2235 domain-containing protein n=1 Tax=Phanerochaete sordida TaxID=48140 RepID=A0A9P3LMG3_9APHY|nr:DUF2235 domain-containing protein [Phanerochaete sordida]
MDAQSSTSAKVTFVAEPIHIAEAIATSAAAPAVAIAPAVEPATVPPSMSVDSLAALAKRRTLVLCFDGTSNQYDGNNTNIVKFYSLLKKDSTDEQLCYYQPGIGTYFQPGVVQPLFQWGAKMLDEAIAWYLDAHVRGGYTFLMQNYRPGDKICIFGFSRGAYTARALAGMLHKIGLLPKDNPEQLPAAYKLFKNCDEDSRELAAGFKRTFCRSVLVEFMGVWDTVASVGLLRSKTLPFTTTNTTIKTFRHALSLDERRCKFQPNLYHRLTPDAAFTVPDVTAVPDDDAPASAVSDISFDDEDKRRRWEEEQRAERAAEDARHRAQEAQNTPAHSGRRTWSWSRVLKRKTPLHEAAPCKRTAFDTTVNPRDDPSGDAIGQTDVLEVWFAGCHGDVGGGTVRNGTETCLADNSLRWMVRHVVQAQCGIAFDSAALARAGVPAATFAGPGLPLTPPAPAPASPTAYKVPRKPVLGVATAGAGHGAAQRPLEAFGVGRAASEASDASTDSARAAAVRDACAPLYDQLVADRRWWLLEVIPTNYCYQDGRGVWHNRWSVHMGRGRHIPDICPKFHESVRERMLDTTLNYRPAAQWREGSEVYVP